MKNERGERPMSEKTPDALDGTSMDKETPEPGDPVVIRRRWRVSLIWLVPVVAALIGVSMLADAWLSTGPEIAVTFRTAAGLEPLCARTSSNITRKIASTNLRAKL